MLDRLTNFLSAFFIRAREASNVTAGPACREGFPKGTSRSAKREDQRRRKHAGTGPDRLTYSFSTARMIAL